MSEYGLFITTSAKRAVKKLPSAVRRKALRELSMLKTNPYIGDKLTRPLHFLFSLHFKFRNVQYRAAYSLNKKDKHIVVHLIGTRQNFYKKLRKLLS